MDRLDLGGLDDTEFEGWLFTPQLFSRSASVILRMTISLGTRELADLPWRCRPSSSWPSRAESAP